MADIIKSGVGFRTAWATHMPSIIFYDLPRVEFTWDWRESGLNAQRIEIYPTPHKMNARRIQAFLKIKHAERTFFGDTSISKFTTA